MKHEKFKYQYLRYNQHFVLRASLSLILIMCFLCKDIFLVAIVGASLFKGGGGQGSDLIALVSPVYIFASLPVFALFYGLVMRQPDAGYLPRLIWENGRYLLFLSIKV